MKLTGLIIAVAAMSVAAPGVTQTQEPGERSTQARLPQGQSTLWSVLRKTRIGEDPVRGRFTAIHPPQVRALAGKTLSLPGFMIPLDAATRGNHFLFSKYTPVCAFCPPGEPNEVVEVRTAKPIVFTNRLTKVTGTFRLQDNGEQGLFFQLTNAAVG